MEFLVVEALAWTRVNGAPEVSLNFCVFADFLRAGDCSLRGRLIRQGLQRLDRVFQLERLLSFTGKFFPEWRPRFLCVERFSDFPLVGLAYLRAESLLHAAGSVDSAAPSRLELQQSFSWSVAHRIPFEMRCRSGCVVRDRTSHSHLPHRPARSLVRRRVRAGRYRTRSRFRA